MNVNLQSNTKTAAVLPDVPLFKLPAVILNHAFSWLDVAAICSFSRTCKFLKGEKVKLLENAPNAVTLVIKERLNPYLPPPAWKELVLRDSVLGKLQKADLHLGLTQETRLRILQHGHKLTSIKLSSRDLPELELLVNLKELHTLEIDKWIVTEEAAIICRCELRSLNVSFGEGTRLPKEAPLFSSLTHLHVQFKNSDDGPDIFSRFTEVTHLTVLCSCDGMFPIVPPDAFPKLESLTLDSFQDDDEDSQNGDGILEFFQDYFYPRLVNSQLKELTLNGFCYDFFIGEEPEALDSFLLLHDRLESLQTVIFKYPLMLYSPIIETVAKLAKAVKMRTPISIGRCHDYDDRDKDVMHPQKFFTLDDDHLHDLRAFVGHTRLPTFTFVYVVLNIDCASPKKIEESLELLRQIPDLRVGLDLLSSDEGNEDKICLIFEKLHDKIISLCNLHDLWLTPKTRQILLKNPLIHFYDPSWCLAIGDDWNLAPPSCYGPDGELLSQADFELIFPHCRHIKNGHIEAEPDEYLNLD